jgi:hypothetical protein
MTEAERLVAAIIGENIPENRVAFAQAWLDTARVTGAAEESQRCREAAKANAIHRSPQDVHAAWMECAECSAKPGSPTLCASCIHNRDTVLRLQRMVDLGEKLRAESAANLQAERDCNFGLGKQLVAAAHDAASLESRLTGMLKSLNGQFAKTFQFSDDEYAVLGLVRQKRLQIRSEFTPNERRLFDRLSEILDRILYA